MERVKESGKEGSIYSNCRNVGEGDKEMEQETERHTELRFGLVLEKGELRMFAC